jgi:molybdopterin synthase sulfur carrier subunit
MTVTVLLFASYADAVGKASFALDLESGATVSDIVRRVRAMSNDHRLPPAPMVAVNERYASSELVLCHGDEVALIPPVAGG